MGAAMWAVLSELGNISSEEEGKKALENGTRGFSALLTGFGKGLVKHHLYCGLSTLAPIGNNILLPMGFTGYTHI